MLGGPFGGPRDNQWPGQSQSADPSFLVAMSRERRDKLLKFLFSYSIPLKKLVCRPIYMYYNNNYFYLPKCMYVLFEQIQNNAMPNADEG